MKKILAIVSMAAMVAGAAFAVDVSADMYLEGDIMSVDADGNAKIEALKTWGANNSGNHRAVTFSVSTDTVGATFGLQDAAALNLGGYSLWFKPVDAVKFTVGNIGTKSIANPMYGDWVGLASFWPYGYQADITMGSFASTVILANGAGNYLFDTTAEGYNKILPSFWIDGRYAVDGVGTFQLYATKGATAIPEMSGWGWSVDDLMLGLAYNKMGYHATGFFAEAAGVFSGNDNDFGNFQAVLGNAGGAFFTNGLGIEGQVNCVYAAEAVAKPAVDKGAVKVGGDVKISYALSSITPWFRFSGFDVMKKNFTPKIGVDGSFGSLSYGAELDVSFSDGKFSGITMPFYMEVKL